MCIRDSHHLIDQARLLVLRLRNIWSNCGKLETCIAYLFLVDLHCGNNHAVTASAQLHAQGQIWVDVAIRAKGVENDSFCFHEFQFMARKLVTSPAMRVTISPVRCFNIRPPRPSSPWVTPSSVLSPSRTETNLPKA